MCKISIIIVNYNTACVLRESLESLFSIEKFHSSYEVIIVDQNSSDNSKEVILGFSEKYPNIKYVFNDKLMSFSYANNIGFSHSAGEYVLIMNPDIIFVEPVLNKMINALEDNPGTGAVCPLLLGEDGVFQHEYFRKYPTLRQFIFFYMVFSKPFYYSAFMRGKYFEIAPDISSGSLEYVTQIPCAFFFTKRITFINSGGMDENYALFFEDVDLSYQINKTSKLALDTSSKIIHYGGSSFATDDNYLLHGRFLISMHYFFDKNYGIIRSSILKVISVSNSAYIVLWEYIKSVFGKRNIHRMLKHSSYLNEFKRVYL